MWFVSCCCCYCYCCGGGCNDYTLCRLFSFFPLFLSLSLKFALFLFSALSRACLLACLCCCLWCCCCCCLCCWCGFGWVFDLLLFRAASIASSLTSWSVMRPSLLFRIRLSRRPWSLPSTQDTNRRLSCRPWRVPARASPAPVSSSWAPSLSTRRCASPSCCRWARRAR